MVGLDALPLPARDEVVQFLRNKERLGALPFVSEGTLAALKELDLSIGKFKASTVDEAVQQAHALRRAWKLGTLELANRHMTDVDVSALAGCTALHALRLVRCRTDVSALAGCATLQVLDLSGCENMVDVSALVGCAPLHTLVLSRTSVRDVSALAACQSLRSLNLTGCRGLTNVSPLARSLTLRWRALRRCTHSTSPATHLRTCRRLRAARCCTRSTSHYAIL